MPATDEEVRNAAPTSEAVDRVADAARRAAHLTHEAKLAKSIIQDSVEDKIHAAKRALKLARRRMGQFQDYKDDAVHYVKHHPSASIAIALASGLVIGVGLGWTAGRRRHPESRETLVANR